MLIKYLSQRIMEFIYSKGNFYMEKTCTIIAQTVMFCAMYVSLQKEQPAYILSLQLHAQFFSKTYNTKQTSATLTLHKCNRLISFIL